MEQKTTAPQKDDAILIFTPIDTKYQDALTHYAPSLGLVALENYLFGRGFVVKIIDGSVQFSKEEIITYLTTKKPKYVGQSVQLISYKNALEIAEVVRSYGGINIFGGHHATQMADAILYNQHNLVDYVIVGDGETAWYALLSGMNITEIPNIVYWKDGKTQHNIVVELSLDELPILDYTRVDLKPYQAKLSESAYSEGKYSNYLRFYSHKGCGNRVGGNGCIFCGRADHNVRFKSPENYWKDVYHCVNEQNADYIFDVGDDFLYSEKYLDQLIITKPQDLKPHDMGIFGRANRVTPETAQILRKIGVADITIGFESGDDSVLKNCNKLFATPAQNIKATELLAREGIEITASYVLGMPGETKESLKNTIKNASEVVKITIERLGRPPKEIVANLLEPTPGSPAFHSLVMAYPDRYYRKDQLDLEMMQRDYFKYFFGLDTLEQYKQFRKTLHEAALEIHSMVSFSDAQGWLVEEY